MSQHTSIKRWLESGHSITPLSALTRFGCFRLGARIYDLRRTMAIKTTIIAKKDKHYASYSIAGK